LVLARDLHATAALAEHYQVWQAAVTWVLRLLAGEGLVRTVPRWGFPHEEVGLKGGLPQPCLVNPPQEFIKVCSGRARRLPAVALPTEGLSRQVRQRAAG
jgi:hypothetical protein